MTDKLENLWVSPVPLPLKPGVFGLMPGGGLAGAAIRHMTDSPVGHAVMYVGNGYIVQAESPKVVEAKAPTANVIWADFQPLTDDQRLTIAAVAQTMVGDGYDYMVYPIFIAALFYATLTKDASKFFRHDHFVDCSALVANCDLRVGIDLTDGLATNLIKPSDLLNKAIANNWTKRTDLQRQYGIGRRA